MDAETITRALGGTWYPAGYGLAFCPAHENTKTPALSLKDGDGGRLLAHCFNGCTFGNLIAALRDRGLVEGNATTAAVDAAEIAHRKQKERDNVRRRARQAEAVWNEAVPIEGTLAELYLRARCISLPLPPTLRFHGACWHPTAKRLPAMVALIQGRENPALHRTYLRPSGRGKALLQPAKAMLGSCAGGAVRLGEPGRILLVGEGIETCLSGMQTTGLPAWAALSTSGLAALQLPQDVRQLIILADGDDPGERAALSSAQRWTREGRKVRVARPPRNKDFNDLLMMGAPRLKEMIHE